MPDVLLIAIGAYQLQQALLAAGRPDAAGHRTAMARTAGSESSADTCTSRCRRCATIESVPVPQPTSSTCWPGSIAACSSRARLKTRSRVVIAATRSSRGLSAKKASAGLIFVASPFRAPPAAVPRRLPVHHGADP